MKKILIFTLVVLMLLPTVSAISSKTNESGVYISDAIPYVNMALIEQSQSGMADNLNFVKVCFSNFESVYSEQHNQHFYNYTIDSLYSSEAILKNIFKTTEYELKKNSYDYTGEIKTVFSEKESEEGSLKIKLTEEKSIMSEIPDTYVSIEKRYVWKDGEYKLSTINVITEIGEKGVYYNASDDYAPTVYNHISTENPVCGYMQDNNYKGEYPNPIIIKNSVHSSKYSYAYYDTYTILKNTIYVDPEIRFSYPEYWNNVVMFDTEIKYSAVDADHSVTGKAVEAGDYNNYQIVSICREIKLVCPDVEEYQAPQTGVDTFAYAAVAVVALASVAVVVKKEKRHKK